MNKQQTRAFVTFYSITGGMKGGLAVCNPKAEQMMLSSFRLHNVKLIHSLKSATAVT